MVGRGDRHRKRISSDHGGDNGTREKASGNHEPGDGIEANGTIDFFGDDVFTQLRGAGGATRTLRPHIDFRIEVTA